jgi:membrane protein DedA with SNARE-associated domain
MNLTDFFTNIIRYAALSGYSPYLLAIIFAFSFLEVVFPLIPGIIVLIIGSAVAAVVGINPVWVIISAFTGTFIASLLLYNLGRRLGYKVLALPRYSWLLDSKTFHRIEWWFERFGFWTLCVSRFLPVARPGIALAAGMVNLRKRLTLSALTISILLSTTVFVLFGRFLGDRWQAVLKIWHPRLQILLYCGGGVLAGIVIWLWWRKRRSEL